MKKLLALVLALVMTLSLCITSNAAFTDAADIEHTEAVEVLSALGVINGKGDNKFDPNGNVTRAEMAKMITIITLGNVDASAFVGTATNLKDVNGHWAEAYIKYCYSQGIIAGKGNNLFDPNANVTAVEAAKMLLVAIGYNAKVQEYTGSDWALNVTRDAQLSDFYDDLTVNANAALTRDQAAQMIYNAINAKMIEKTSIIDRTDGSISDSYAPVNKKLLSETFGAKTWVGTFTKNDKMGAADDEVVVNGKLDTAAFDAPTSNASFPAELDVATIGEEYKVIFKDGKAGHTGEPDKKDTIYGVYLTGETDVLTTTLGEIQKIDTTDDFIKFGGVEHDYKVFTSTTHKIVTDFGASADLAFTETNMDGVLYNITGDDTLQDSSVVKFILNDDGDIVDAYITNYAITKVTAVTSEKVSLYGVGAIKLEDNSVYEGVAKDDVVVYTKLYKSAVDKAYFTVEKAEVVSGKITAYTGTSKVSLDGTSYKIFNKALANLTSDKLLAIAGEVDSTVDAYMVNGMVGALNKTSGDTTLYGLVVDSNTTTTSGLNTGKIQVLNAEGTKVIYEVNKDSTLQAGALAKGDVIKYVVKEDGTVKVSAEGGANAVALGAKVWNADTKQVGGAVAAGDAVIFVKTSASPETFKAYNIRNLKTITAAASGNVYTILDSDNKVVAAYYDNGAVPAGGGNDTYGYVLSQDGVTKIGDDDYSMYTLYTGAEENVTVYIKGTSSTALTKKTMYSFSLTSDCKYESAAEFSSASTAVAVKEYSESDKTITYYTGTSYNSTSQVYDGTGVTTKAVDKDVKVIYVDHKNGAVGENIGVCEFDSMTGYKNATLFCDTDGVVVAIFVETSAKTGF